MKIQSIKVYSKLLPLKRPYTITRETISEAKNTFLEITLANGIKGIGSANTDVAVVGETAEQTLHNLQSEYVNQLVGQDIRQFMLLIYNARQHFLKFPGTQAAIDIALHDAFCQWLGISVTDFYGRHHQKMLTSVTIGIKDVAGTIHEAEEYFQSGFKVLKVKTGLDPEQDAERVIKVRERFKDHFIIRVDANEGYTIPQLNSFLVKTRDCNLELIEQPLPAGREADVLTLPAEVRRILAGDESLKNAQSALTLAQNMTYGIFNIKLMKCGGLRGAIEIATIAQQADIALFWGCNDESMVSITAALQVAFACPHTKYIDLDGSFDLAQDIVINGFILEDGYLIPNTKPGLGLTLL